MRRRVWLGVRSESTNNGCFVTGQALPLPEDNHLSMLSRSYEIPVETVTGSLMTCSETGQRKWDGISSSVSISASFDPVIEESKEMH